LAAQRSCNRAARTPRRPEPRTQRGFASGVSGQPGAVYSRGELDEIADRAARLVSRAVDTHIVFNNNKSNDAPKAAER
jgi:hypothetical protein